MCGAGRRRKTHPSARPAKMAKSPSTISACCVTAPSDGISPARGAPAVAMIAWFFAGANVSMVAFTAGAALLLTRRVKPEKVFLEINWNLLTLFAGLFVVVGAARAAGVTDALFDALHAVQATRRGEACLALWLSDRL